MDDPAILERFDHVRGRQVAQIRIDNEFWLEFQSPESNPPSVQPLFLAIGGAFTVVAPDGERHDFESEYTPSDLGPATRLLWKTVSDLCVDGRGNLALDFDDGSELLIPTDERYEAWRLTGKGLRTLASPPGGGVPKWPVKETGVAGTPEESTSRPEFSVRAKLQPPLPTPLDERCTCTDAPPLKLMSMMQIGGFNPIHCLKCNLEVESGRLALPTDLIEEIAAWHWEHGALETLELASGEFEEWARRQLLNPASSTNARGRELTVKISAHHPCYFWFFQPQSDVDWQPPEACPVCGDPLKRYDEGIFAQLICEQDRIVLVGESS